MNILIEYQINEEEGETANLFEDLVFLYPHHYKVFNYFILIIEFSINSNIALKTPRDSTIWFESKMNDWPQLFILP